MNSFSAISGNYQQKLAFFFLINVILFSKKKVFLKVKNANVITFVGAS
jgi:hypothetical protein